MTIDTYCYFPNANPKVVGGLVEDKTMKEKGAFVVVDYEIGAENSINIGSISQGGGAGKASFKELTLSKTIDGASCDLFDKLVTGHHYSDMVIELHRPSGSSGSKSGVFVKWEFKLVMVQDIIWNGSAYDEQAYETVVMRYGAMKTTYYPKGKKGKSEKKSAEWSQVLNKAQLGVE